jgi:hypothetical protein
MDVVTPNERSAAAGVSGFDWRRDFFTIVAVFLGHPLLLDGPFFVACGFKVFYETAMTMSSQAENEPMLQGGAQGCHGNSPEFKNGT